jgi:uncharacterized protein YcfL
MKRTTEFRALVVCCLALVFSVLLVMPAVQAADASDGEDSNDSNGSINSKIERLGKIKRLKVIEMRAVQRDGLLQVQATLLNGRLNQDIVYRTKWLDKDGFSVWDDEAWKPLALYARQKQNLLLVAPTPKATDFRIELQGATVHKKAQN